MKVIIVTVVLLSGCGAVRQFPNVKRGVVSAEWIPNGSLQQSADYSGPEFAGLVDDGKPYNDESKADPEFHCIEPVTPASKLHGASGKVGAGPGGDTVTVEGNYTQELGKIYDISDVVLLAQTAAFQACLARLSGDLTVDKYIAELDSIRDTATDLVRAQTAGAEGTVLAEYADIVREEAWCREAVGGLEVGSAAHTAKTSECEVYKNAQTALLAALTQMKAVEPSTPGGSKAGKATGQECAHDKECASTSCDPATKVCM